MPQSSPYTYHGERGFHSKDGLFFERMGATSGELAGHVRITKWDAATGAGACVECLNRHLESIGAQALSAAPPPLYDEPACWHRAVHVGTFYLEPELWASVIAFVAEART